MKTGKDYIVFALDVASVDEVKKYVTTLNNKVGMFKIGLELFVQTGPEIIRRVKDLTDASIFLDLKFHDIANTVKKAMERVADLGVGLVTVHCSSSHKMVEMAVKGGLKNSKINSFDGKIDDGKIGGSKVDDGKIDGVKNPDVGVLGVTLLTDNDASVIQANGFKDIYVNDIYALVLKRAATAYSAGCRGVVCSGQEAGLIKAAFGRDFLVVTPGIRPEWSITKEDDQKRITTPAMAVKAGADLIVVGRPIRDSNDPAYAAQKIADEIDEVLIVG